MLKHFRTLAALALLAGTITVAPCSWAANEGMSLTHSGSASNDSAIQAISTGAKNMDLKVKPCEDFYLYANGTWLKNTPIPNDQSSWGVLDIIEQNNLAILRKIMEHAAASGAKPATIEQKVGDFYFAGMDTDKIEAQGAKPLQAELDRIDAIKNENDLQDEIARLHRYGIDVLFGITSEQDRKESTKVIAELWQGGLGLPDRDYYTKTDEASKKLQQQYVDHVTRMLELLGYDKKAAGTKAATVMRIETNLAQNQMTNVERRDPVATYNKMSATQVSDLMPHLGWKKYLTNIGHPEVDSTNVSMPKFFKAVDGMLADVSIDDWKDYLRWHLVNDTASLLSSKFVDEDFDFSGRTLNGTKENLPRWKRMVQATNRAMGQAVGQLYVAERFPPESKAKILDLVAKLKAVLKQDLSELEWMTPETRKNAIEKMDAFGQKIGYPDKWRDYSALQIDRNSLVWNALNANQFELNRMLDKIGKPVDRTDWAMAPQIVNAYYAPDLNEIVFPAGILQPPLFDPKADDATNFGAIGMIIGHEMTHGFDDSGSKFDGSGNLRNWWSADDLKRFDQRISLLQTQYDGYHVSGNVHLKGKLVSGEAAADLGGLTLAYKALEHELGDAPRPKDANGFTPEQRFFLSFAQAWATNLRPESEQLRANTDQHPTPHFRVNGTVANMDAFDQAFSCPNTGAMMLPTDKRCRLW